MATKKEEHLKTITELALLAPEIQPSLLKFEVTRKQLENEALLCMKIKVNDKASLSVCENSLTKLNDLVKSVETVRVAEKAPYLRRGDAIDAAAKYVTSLPKDAIKDSLDKIGETLKSKLESITSIEALDKYVEAIKKFDYKSKYDMYADEAIKIKDLHLPLFELKRKGLEAIETGT